MNTLEGNTPTRIDVAIQNGVIQNIQLMKLLNPQFLQGKKTSILLMITDPSSVESMSRKTCNDLKQDLDDALPEYGSPHVSTIHAQTLLALASARAETEGRRNINASRFASCVSE